MPSAVLMYVGATHVVSVCLRLADSVFLAELTAVGGVHPLRESLPQCLIPSSLETT